MKASEEDIKYGRVITNQQLNEEEDKWLNKQFGHLQHKKQEQQYLSFRLNTTKAKPTRENLQNNSTQG